MGSFSLVHWLIVLAVVLLLFGPKRLPDLAKGVGEAIREFKKAINAPDNKNNQLTHHDKDKEKDRDPNHKDGPT